MDGTTIRFRLPPEPEPSRLWCPESEIRDLGKRGCHESIHPQGPRFTGLTPRRAARTRRLGDKEAGGVMAALRAYRAGRPAEGAWESDHQAVRLASAVPTRRGAGLRTAPTPPMEDAPGLSSRVATD